jgi:triosephosphate isomerase
MWIHAHIQTQNNITEKLSLKWIINTSKTKKNWESLSPVDLLYKKALKELFKLKLNSIITAYESINIIGKRIHTNTDQYDITMAIHKLNHQITKEESKRVKKG